MTEETLEQKIDRLRDRFDFSGYSPSSNPYVAKRDEVMQLLSIIDAQAEALRQRDVLLERAREGMLKAKMHRYDPARVYQTLKETLAALETKQVEG